jgi:hypothetical protein
MVQGLVISVLGYLVSISSTAGQKSQNRKISTQAGPPPSLQRKRECLEAQIQKWQKDGKDPQPIGETLQDFQPLMEQQKFAEAERVVDRALNVAGGTCPDQANADGKAIRIGFGGFAGASTAARVIESLDAPYDFLSFHSEGPGQPTSRRRR